MKLPRTPYEKLVLAMRRGTGCRLSAEDVERLSFDDAITTRAGLDEEQRAQHAAGEHEVSCDECFWCGQHPWDA